MESVAIDFSKYKNEKLKNSKEYGEVAQVMGYCLLIAKMRIKILETIKGISLGDVNELLCAEFDKENEKLINTHSIEELNSLEDPFGDMINRVIKTLTKDI